MFKIQLTIRWLIIIAFLACYLLFTLLLAQLEHSCPTLEQLAELDEKRALGRLGTPPNGTFLESGVNLAPLAKLGLRLPLREPPTDGQKVVDRDPKRPVTQPPTPQTTYYAHERQNVSWLLRSDFVPNNVFYVWCGRRWFEFSHYLSVISVIRSLRPDNIIFFYDELPVTDEWLYNTWFDEIKDSYPFFRLWQLDEHDRAEACQGHAAVSDEFIRGLLRYRGGMYIHENTIISDFNLSLRNKTLVYGLDPRTRQGFVLTQRGVPPKGVTFDDLLKTRGHDVHTVQCADIVKYIELYKKPMCVNINPNQVLFPKDIWHLENSFGRLVRRIFYGNESILRPTKSYDDLVPNIAHVVWLGGGEMDFLFYLCVLSLIYVAEVDSVYIHGDAPPTGPYWERLLNEPKLHLIYRASPEMIYGQRVEVISHVTDIWRVDFMLRYGGIYVDTDTAFVRPLDREIRSYDAVASYDWTYWNPPFPDTINFGVTIGKRGAPFWKEFQKSMRWFLDKDWSWNGLRQPYKILERNPSLLRIDPHLQVICFQSKCHPTWVDNYHNESIHHLNTASILNWKNDTYAFHWTLPTPVELLNEDNLQKSDSIFAEIGKYILKKAGRL